ncbi:hypothetical protein ACG74X_17830 [Marivita sp. S0852]|uniref:hypothetical protein n=1 Tax=Marivita sp. S0852 TaxID=3373893 RepID=UPI003981AE90
MDFKKNTIRLIGAPVVLSLLSTPMLASTQSQLGLPDTVQPRPVLELIYPKIAQVGGDDIGGGGQSRDGGEGGSFTSPVPSGPPVQATEATTAMILFQMDRNETICEFMDDEYRIGCFAATYRELANEIPGNGDYAEAREVILKAARELDQLTRRNIDRQKPPLRARLSNESGPSASTPPIAAIRSDAVAQVNRQASNILQEAETVLLRSASSDATRAIHYQRIAAAVGSNKVLLRSS